MHRSTTQSSLAQITLSLRANILTSSAIAILFVGGCSKEPVPPVRFEPNLVHAMKHQIKEDMPTGQASEDALWIANRMFGTPDDPKLPTAEIEDFREGLDEAFPELISLERLHSAAGPLEAGRGLYRKHCANCHGVTGNGRGETAAILNPYPRDYRMGVFKFKSTKRSAKPIRSDLVNLIANGIQGTAMKKIPELTNDDVEALTDYVIYLSIRGELERKLVDFAIYELDLESGDRILDYQLANWIRQESEKRNPSTDSATEHSLPEFTSEELIVNGESIDESLLDDFRTFKADARLQRSDASIRDELRDLQQLVSAYDKMNKPMVADEDSEEEELTFSEKAELMFDDYELLVESWAYAEELTTEIVDSWLTAADDVIEVPEPPSDIPVPETYEDFVKMSEGDQSDLMADSVKRGQELFVGKIASCSKCHGEKGLGNGTTNDYDDWTKDWTSNAGLKPDNRESLIPLLARGALPPRNALPRNFSEGIFRGGASSADLYRRIVAGIAGTPMPAATFVPGEFEEHEVWHIINFIRSLQVTPTVPEPPRAEQIVSKP